MTRLGTLIDSLMVTASYCGAESIATEALSLVHLIHGAEDSRLAPWFVKLGQIRLELARYDDAQELFQRALDIERAHGSRNSEIALSAMQGITRRYLACGSIPEAGEWAQRCTAVSRKVYGARDAHCAEDLRLLAQTRTEQDRINEGSDLLDKAIRIIEEQWGAKHEDLADILTARADVACDRGKYDRATSLYERSLAIKTHRWGLNHPETTAPLLGLSRVCNVRGDFLRADSLARRCVEIRERDLGSDHPAVAVALHIRASHLAELGDYPGAVDAYQRSFDIRIEVFGEQSAEAASVMMDLGLAFEMVGRSAESIRLIRRAAEIMEQVRGPEHSKTAVMLIGLGHHLLGQRSTAEAEALFRRSLRILERTYGRPNPHSGVLRGFIGRCLGIQRRLEEARRVYEQGIADATQVYGPESHQVALIQRRFGYLLQGLWEFEEAHSVLQGCLTTLQQRYGPKHPYLCMCLKTLLVTSLSLGLTEEARVYADQALATYEHAFGRGHKEVVLILKDSALVDAFAGRWDEALAKTMRATEIGLAMQERIYEVSTEHEALVHSRISRGTREHLLGLMHAAPDLPETTMARIFSLVVRTHGRILDRLAERQQHSSLAADTSEIGTRHQAFLSAAQRLADLHFRWRLGNRTEHLAELNRARRDKEAAERALSEVSERFRLQVGARKQERNLSPGTLAHALPPRSFLIHFVRYPAYEFIPADRSSEKIVYASWKKNPHHQQYGAFCLCRTASESWTLDFVGLGSSPALDSLIATYRRSIESVAVTGRPTARDEAQYRAASRDLYSKLWAPLMAAAKENLEPAGTTTQVPTVFLVPTSHLHLVDFNTLFSPAGDLVIEQWKVHLLSSATDLLRLSGSSVRSVGEGLLAVGNPACQSWDLETTGRQKQTEVLPAAPRCFEDYRSPGPLPGAEEETRAVCRLYSEVVGEPVTLLAGSDATEDAVKRHLAGKRIVHLATHGFFCDAAEAGQGSSRYDLTNPLLLSGIVLVPDHEGNDGLLTALEIVGHDLRKLEWVVLGACGSGLGGLLPTSGEGPIGLRRAFAMAGARTVVMALWRIRDEVSRDLMERIYRRRLAGSSTIDAIRLAQLERLRDQRARFNRIHPALWGGIVAEGDWH